MHWKNGPAQDRNEADRCSKLHNSRGFVPQQFLRCLDREPTVETPTRSPGRHKHLYSKRPPRQVSRHHPRVSSRGPSLRAFRAGPVPVPCGSPTAHRTGGGSQLTYGHYSRCSSRRGQAPAGRLSLGHPPCTPSGSPPARDASGYMSSSRWAASSKVACKSARVPRMTEVWISTVLALHLTKSSRNRTVSCIRSTGSWT